MSNIFYEVHLLVYRRFKRRTEKYIFKIVRSITKNRTNISNKENYTSDKMLQYNENKISHIEFVRLLL